MAYTFANVGFMRQIAEFVSATPVFVDKEKVEQQFRFVAYPLE
jgi:hypothetical protein